MRKHNRNSAGKKKGLVLFILATFLFATIIGSAITVLSNYDPYTNSGGLTVSLPAVSSGSNPSVSATSPIDAGQGDSLTISATIPQGQSSSNYAFMINGNTVATVTASNPSFEFSSLYVSKSYTWTPSSAGTYTFEGSASGIGSASVSITVNSPPPAISVSISTSQSTIDLGQSLTLTMNPSGGSGGNAYSWSGSGSFGSSGSQSTSWSDGYTGTYTITGTVTDSDGTKASATVSLTVDGDPSISLSSSKNPSDVGQAVDYSTAASGGSGTFSSYSYIIYDGTSTSDAQLASGGSSSASYTYSSTGQFLVYYSVTDSNGYTVSTSLTQTVNSDPSVTISSSQNPSDTGNTVEFSSTVSGGTPGYTYTWIINGNTYSTRDVNISFSSSGTYIADLTVTDAAGYSVSQSYSQTVNSDPTVSASSNVSSADVGYPIEFLSSPSGGVGPYTYSWVINGNQVSTSQDFSYTFSSPGSYTATVTVTDSVGKTYSASATVTINSNPSVSITSPQNPTDVGNSVNFKSSVSGGTGSDTYVWTINGAQESTSSAFSYSFNSVGTYYVNLTVTDGDSHVGSASFVEHVNSDPSVVIHTIHNPTDVGTWANFSASVSGGTPGYAYSWTINGQNFNASYVNYTFTSAGTFQVQLGVTDANGNKATDTINEVVNPLPAVSIQAKYSTVDQGVNDTFFADITGGSSPFNYTWTLGSGIVNYSQQFHLNFTSTGSYEINLTVRDSLGSTVSTSISVKVIPKPSALIEGSNITDVGTQTYWEGYGSFGSEPYSYYWFINGVNTTIGLYLLYSFPKAGNYNITLLIEDSQGAKAKTYLDIAVVPLPRVAVQLSKSITDTGIPVEFNSSVTGGDPFFNFSWSISGIGFVGYQQDIHYAFAHSGNYTVTVTVYDGSGNSATNSLSIEVHNSPKVSFQASYSNIDPNVTDSFNSLVTGGTPGYQFEWYVNQNKVGFSSTLNYTFHSPGIYVISQSIEDSQGETASYVADVTVSSYPQASIIFSGQNVDANVSETYRASSFGGIGPYSYEWIIGGQEYANSTVTHAFGDPGNYTVQLIVSDAFGKDATSTLNITVNSDPRVSVQQMGKAMVSQPADLIASVSGGIPAYQVHWIFPDGQQESGLNISHVFETSGPIVYEVVVQDQSGFRGTYNFSIEVGLYVTISDSTASGLAPLKESFFSDVLGGSGLSYNWKFGNGNTSVAQNPQETFSTGNYTVTLKVTSSNGATGNASLTVTSLPPPVGVSYSPGTNITVLSTVHFIAIPNWDAAGPYNGTWSFPDGQTEIGMNVSYTFPVYQEFNPVIFTFSYGEKTLNETLNVRMVPALPDPVISSIPSVIPVGTILAVNGSASHSPDANIVTYTWKFNNETYTGEDQFFQFNRTGNYSITLTVKDALGATSSKVVNVEALRTGTNSTITFVTSSSKSGPYVYYSIAVYSKDGISAVEAFLGSQSLPLVLVKENGSAAVYNLTVNQQDYQSGTYGITVIAFNNQSQSNSLSVEFSVSSSFGKSGFDLVTALGGPVNFWLIILTSVGTIATVYGVTRHGEEIIDINGTKLEGKPGKTLKLVKGGRKK